jgi:hypothetical protein
VFVTNDDIRHWVEDRYSFTPPAFWINHCKELYLHPNERPSPRDPRNECPPDKRLYIRDAFVYFGLLADQQRAMTGSGI